MIDYDTMLSRVGRRLQQSEIRKMGTLLAQTRDVISFAPGYADPATFAWQDFREIASELLGGRDGTVLQYGPTRGHKPLLEAIAAMLARRGVTASLDQLLITTGSQQGVDLVGRVLVDPGDPVLVELPSYTGAITAFRGAQADLVGVAQGADGLDLDALESALVRLRSERRPARVLYVVPNFQNPTGLLLPRDKRKKLLALAARHDMIIVEDDPYGDLYFEDCTRAADTRPIKADDEEGRVVYLSSFSKTLAPGFRVAWLVAPAALAARFEIAKQAEDLCTSSLDQRIVYEACRRGVLDRQAPVLRQHYQRKRDVMVGALRQELGDVMTWPAPRGGFFLWAALPGHVSAEGLLRRAIAHQVIYVAGGAFHVDGSGANRLRLSFSAPTPERIVEGINRLASAVREELSAPTAVPR